jgi:hypothetical protein
MTYRAGIYWNDLTELECLLILKKCEREGFPRGMHAELCRELAKRKYTPDASSLIAKVGNYKSLAGLSNPSKWSTNSERLYKKYKNHSIAELRRVIDDSNIDHEGRII